MAAKWQMALKIVGGVILAAVLFAVIAAPAPNLRHHPNRKAVRFWHMWSGEWKDVVLLERRSER